MDHNELANIKNEFISLSKDLLNSTESTFSANLSGFKEFCNSNQVIMNILEPVLKTDFNGEEYFCKKSNPEYRFEKLVEPKNRNELLKFSYDVLWSKNLNSHHIWNYALWALYPNTKKTNELLQIGTKDISERLIKFIILELEKLITNTETANIPNQLNFNIENASGSIIGTQQNATINNGASLEEISKYIQNTNIDSSDKEQLLELTNCLKTLTENNVPMSKGALAKFSDIVSKHSWCLTLIGNALIKHFIS